MPPWTLSYRAGGFHTTQRGFAILSLKWHKLYKNAIKSHRLNYWTASTAFKTEFIPMQVCTCEYICAFALVLMLFFFITQLLDNKMFHYSSITPPAGTLRALCHLRLEKADFAIFISCQTFPAISPHEQRFFPYLSCVSVLCAFVLLSNHLHDEDYAVLNVMCANSAKVN